MEALRSWTVTVCTAAVVCTLLYRLFPDTGIGRQGRMLLPCLFLCALLMPLTAVDLSGALTMPDTSVADGAELTARMRQQVSAQVNETLLAMVNQALGSYGFSAKKVTADMDIREDGSISMGQITVYVDEETAQRSVLVKQVAEKRLGTGITLVLLEEHG